MNQAAILIVEDEVIVAADLESKLKRLGYQVIGQERSGEEAMAAALRQRPDLVLMDIRLAGIMDGIEAAVTLRREIQVPVVFLTAHSDALTLERAGHAEAFGFLLKPFEERELRTHIEMALYKHATEQRLREADQRKTEFIALLSHELRNPLAAIRNGMRVLTAAPQDSERAHRSRIIIDRQINQLVRLVDDLLDVSRITQNKLQLVCTRLSLVDLVQRIIEDHRPQLEEHQIRLVTSFCERTVCVNGDAARLSQVIGNVLHNAVKFTPPHGTITVTVAVDNDPLPVVVRVADTGDGIDAPLLAVLFQPFVQADRTLAHGQGGLGLGLSVVHGIVALHDGEVRAMSAGAGQGAEFVVRLPLDDGRGAEIASTPTALPVLVPPVSVRRRVLVIEDNRDVAEALCQSLELEGHEVEVAHSALEGIEKARHRRPEFALCDIGLPGMNGYDLARVFRADSLLRSIYLVAISGYARPKDVAEALDAGFDEHLAKPVNPQRLSDLLSRFRIRASAA